MLLRFWGFGKASCAPGSSSPVVGAVCSGLHQSNSRSSQTRLGPAARRTARRGTGSPRLWLAVAHGRLAASRHLEPGRGHSRQLQNSCLRSGRSGRQRSQPRIPGLTLLLTVAPGLGSLHGDCVSTAARLRCGAAPQRASLISCNPGPEECSWHRAPATPNASWYLEIPAGTDARGVTPPEGQPSVRLRAKRPASPGATGPRDFDLWVPI